MIIHWNSKDAGPTSQVIILGFNIFTSAPLTVVSVTGAKYRGFIVNVNKLGLR